MNDVTVIIPISGDLNRWAEIAQRAYDSAVAQTYPAKEVIISSGKTLTEARNKTAMEADTEFLVFLDADDELDSHYLEQMVAGSGDLRQPSTLGIVDGREDPEPVLIPSKPLITGNYLVIGTMVRRELFAQVGGFRDWPMYEDWELFIRCWLEGATITACPQAIYRVHVNADSRNNQHRTLQIETYNQIRNLHEPVARAKGLM